MDDSQDVPAVDPVPAVDAVPAVVCFPTEDGQLSPTACEQAPPKDGESGDGGQPGEDSQPGEDKSQPSPTLLQDLDSRQNDVLEQLDALNNQIEALIADWTRKRRDKLLSEGEETRTRHGEAA